MPCSRCAAILPDGSQFCLKCGQPVASPAHKADAGDLPIAASPVPSRKTERSPRPLVRKGWIVLCLVLGLFVIGIVWAATSTSPFAQGLQELAGWQHDETILGATFSIGPHNFRYYKIAPPQDSTHVAVVGQFTSSNEAHTPAKAGEDTAGNIELYILSEPAFAVWQNGYAASSVYDSGRLSQAVVQAELPTGTGIYYLVFSNKFSSRTAKSVHATFLLRYKPRSFFSIRMQ